MPRYQVGSVRKEKRAEGLTSSECLLCTNRGSKAPPNSRSINSEALDRAVRKRYPGWVKANIRPSTLPPKA